MEILCKVLLDRISIKHAVLQTEGRFVQICYENQGNCFRGVFQELFESFLDVFFFDSFRFYEKNSLKRSWQKREKIEIIKKLKISYEHHKELKEKTWPAPPRKSFSHI